MVGEEAVDEGGVLKEFFMLISKELLTSAYGMFRYYEESRLLWFNEDVFVLSKFYHSNIHVKFFFFSLFDTQFPISISLYF